MELAPKLGPFFIIYVISFANAYFFPYYPVCCLSKFIIGLISTPSVVISGYQRVREENVAYPYLVIGAGFYLLVLMQRL